MPGRPAGLRVAKGEAAPLLWPDLNEMTSPPRRGADPDDPIKIAEPVSALLRPLPRDFSDV